MMSQCSSPPPIHARDSPCPRGRESHHELMRHKLNFEPGSSTEKLDLRKRSKVIARQQSTRTGLAESCRGRRGGGKDLTEDYISPKKGKINLHGLLTLAMTPAIV